MRSLLKLATLSLLSAAAPMVGAAAAETVRTGTAHDALFAVDMSGALGVAVGAGGEIIESADGGKSWKSVGSGDNQLSLLGVHLGKEGTGLAVGQMGVLFHRDAAGKWSKVDSGSKERLFAVDLNAANQAVVTGAFGTVLYSTDGGNGFSRLTIDWSAFAADGAEPHLYAADITDEGQITVAGEFGLILRSNDAGATWRKLNQGDASIFALEINAVGKPSYAVGQIGTLLRSDDGGEVWSVQNSGSTANLLAVKSLGQTVLVAGFRESVVSNDGGTTWSGMSQAPFGGSWYGGLTADGNSVFAVGQSGTVVRLQQ
jgi:photosystem II stability/assembly factor-like uncharacterized protein